MYTGYYIPRDDGDHDLVCILANEEEVDDEIATTLRHSVEGRLSGTGNREWKKIEGPDPDGFPQVLIMEDINDI